jgi:hypothetical protein
VLKNAASVIARLPSGFLPGGLPSGFLPGSLPSGVLSGESLPSAAIFRRGRGSGRGSTAFFNSLLSEILPRTLG